MAYEMKDLTGSLFKNQKKTTESHPGAKGSCLINGVEYWVSAWTKKDKNGAPWQSLAFKLKEEKPIAKKEDNERKVQGNDDGFDDNIPF